MFDFCKRLGKSAAILIALCAWGVGVAWAQTDVVDPGTAALMGGQSGLTGALSGSGDASQSQSMQTSGRGGMLNSLPSSGQREGLPSLGARGMGNGAGNPFGAGVGPQTLSPDALANALSAPPPLEPTLFQKFVQDATGKNLPLYGYQLFDRGRFPADDRVPVPTNYVVGPGDELDLKLWGTVDLNTRLPVDRHGQITVPEVGPITVAGVRASELDEFLKKRIGKVFRNFDLTATVGKLRSLQIYVVGHARAPGSYTVSSLSTLVSALFESGGPSATGSMRKIRLIRAGSPVTTIDLYKFLQSGDLTADARLLSGDVIMIPPAGPQVALTGEIDKPAIYELSEEEETLQQVLRYNGASTVFAAPHKVLVERLDGQRRLAPREVQERALDKDGLNSTVRNGDLITLLKLSPSFSNAVTLQGAVARPLRYQYRPGMKVSDLIPEVDALIVPDYYAKKNILVQYDANSSTNSSNNPSNNPSNNSSNDSTGVSNEDVAGNVKRADYEINWAYASIERLDRNQVRSRLITFDLAKAVREKDPANDLTLLPGDVVTVYSVADLPVPLERRIQHVKVSGEVMAPGIYEMEPGQTILDAIKRAGGFTSKAYVYGTVFSRESTRARQQANLDQAIRKLQIQLTSQSNQITQNGTSLDQSALLLQAQKASQQASLERLKTLKPNGRIALEIDPRQQDIPAIELEDGDSITIPLRPNFVSVFGAVYAESAFVHREGYTVRDYLEKAGPTRDADLEAMMVLRADGTLVSNKAYRSWIGLGQSAFMSTPMYSGDTVIVPDLVDKRTSYVKFMEGAKDWTQMLYQFGLGAAAFKVLKN
jgi:protein involved in polysaccharide export with SLBB domain